MTRLESVYHKVLSGQELDRWIVIAGFKGKSIVFTNGCFDVLHRGHIEYLAKAAELGDLLVIGLNTDASVKKLKGPERPYLDQITRSHILASMSFVSAVVLFSEETPYNLISRIKPQYLVKGGDYDVEKIVGYDVVTAYGGQVLTIPLVPGFSSTGVISKMKEAHG
jgi:D-glycero-beta-D-manno-heptose 1-phosphate adenylyltransferase